MRSRSSRVMSAVWRSRLLVVLVLLVGMAPWMLGCFGSFPLTHGLYKFNADVSKSGIVRTVVFWVFVIFPVYEIAMIGDAVIFNLVEFWGGENVQVSSVTDENGVTTALASAANGRDAVLTFSRDGKVLGEERFVRASDNTFEVRGVDGTLHGKVLRTDGGDILLADAQGKTVGKLTAESLAALRTK